jgi:hypothetical protein
MSTIPTVDVYRDGKHARINEADLPAWQAQGWVPAKAEEAASLEEEVVELQAALDEDDEVEAHSRQLKK